MSAPHEVDPNMIVPTTLKETDLRFYDVRKSPFTLYGLWEPQTEPKFKRLPDALAAEVSYNVKVLATNTAGGRVRFSTDSPYIAIKAIMPSLRRFDHMPPNGTSGFDLYIDHETESRYQGTLRCPIMAEGGFEAILYLPDRRMRSFTINFPPYNDLDALYVGLAEDAVVGEGKKYRPIAPIYYYGSSITQGACASRPGLSYQNHIIRRVNIDYVNLGFSGSAKGEPSIVNWMAEREMSCFVCDYDHNAPSVEHLAETYYPLYAAIHEKHPDIPYIMVSRPDYVRTPNAPERREIILDTYHRALAAGDRKVTFIDGQSLFRVPGWDNCTVDGTHPNDLGFFCMAEAIGEEIARYFG